MTIEQLIGTRSVEAALADGTTRTVTVRELPIRTHAQFAAALGDPAALVDLYAGAPGLADQLSRQGLIDILDAGDALNLDFFAALFDRSRRRVERLVPAPGPESAAPAKSPAAPEPSPSPTGSATSPSPPA